MFDRLPYSTLLQLMSIAEILGDEATQSANLGLAPEPRSRASANTNP